MGVGNILGQELCTPRHITWPTDLAKQPLKLFLAVCCAAEQGLIVILTLSLAGYLLDSSPPLIIPAA